MWMDGMNWKIAIAAVAWALSVWSVQATGESYKDLLASDPAFAASEAKRHELASNETNSKNNVINQTRSDVANIHDETNSSNWNFSINGDQNNGSFNLGVAGQKWGIGLQGSKNEQKDSSVEQIALTPGLILTPGQDSALSRVIENGVIKLSLVRSEIEHATSTDFNETAEGLEFIMNLKLALKQVAVSYSKHNLDISNGEDLPTTSVINGNNVQSMNLSEDVETGGIQLLFGIVDNLDLLLRHRQNSLWNSSTGGAFQYRFNDDFSFTYDIEKTSNFSGSTEQKIQTATMDYNNGGFRASLWARDNGIDTEPYAQLSYSIAPKWMNPNSPRKSDWGRLDNNVTTPVWTATHTHPDAITTKVWSETPATPTVTATPNQAPTAVGDAITIQFWNNWNLNVLTNDTDPDGDTLTLVNVTSGTPGLNIAGFNATWNVSIDAATTPGNYTISYVTRDPDGLTANGNIAVTITP